MTAFHEVRFPDAIAYGATGGPVWSTTIAALSTGAEQRNQNWVNARHRWNVATGIKRLADFHQVLRFFQARRGRAWEGGGDRTPMRLGVMGLNVCAGRSTVTAGGFERQQGGHE